MLCLWVVLCMLGNVLHVMVVGSFVHVLGNILHVVLMGSCVHVFGNVLHVALYSLCAAFSSFHVHLIVDVLHVVAVNSWSF